MNDLPTIPAILTLILVALISIILTAAHKNSYWKNEAVKQGHAEFYLDENNEKQWRWKAPATQPR